MNPAAATKRIPAGNDRAALHGDFKEPIGNAVAGTTGLRKATRQAGDVRNFSQFAAERRPEGLFLQFHDWESSREWFAACLGAIEFFRGAFTH